MARVSRIIALGASNLTRGLPTVVSAARTTWGHDVELLGALGHGRSYGIPSRFAARTLPGILQSGLWRTLDSLSPATSRGLVTDVGNDVIYEVPASLILEWVEDAVDRLQTYTADVVLTDLPVDAIKRLRVPAFIAVRTLVAPRCRLTLSAAVETVERVNYGLAQMADRVACASCPCVLSGTASIRSTSDRASGIQPGNIFLATTSSLRFGRAGAKPWGCTACCPSARHSLAWSKRECSRADGCAAAAKSGSSDRAGVKLHVVCP